VTCAVSQQLFDKKTNKRVLLIALSAEDQGGVKGSLVMPFGLALDSGVTLQIDDGPLTKPIHFRTCLPGGCIIPLEWPAATVQALGAARSLKAAAVADDGQPAPFTISMKGFASALDRAVALTLKQ
jgi:invasion protein IalB